MQGHTHGPAPFVCLPRLALPGLYCRPVESCMFRAETYFRLGSGASTLSLRTSKVARAYRPLSSGDKLTNPILRARKRTCQEAYGLICPAPSGAAFTAAAI